MSGNVITKLQILHIFNISKSSNENFTERYKCSDSSVRDNLCVYVNDGDGGGFLS